MGLEAARPSARLGTTSATSLHLTATSPVEVDLLYNSFPVYDADMTIEGYYNYSYHILYLYRARDKASHCEDNIQSHRNRGNQTQHACGLFHPMQNKNHLLYIYQIHCLFVFLCRDTVTGLNSFVQTIPLQVGALNTNFSSCPFPTSPPLWSHSFMFH